MLFVSQLSNILSEHPHIHIPRMALKLLTASLHFLFLVAFVNIAYMSFSPPICPPFFPSQALEERLKQEQREEVHALKEAHRRTFDILRQQSDQELQTLRFELEDEGKAKLGK